MIIREKYLSKIRPFYDVDLIKVITGIRRCGKSVILTQMIDELKEKGITEDHIVYINFESKEYSFLQNDDDLYQYVKGKLVDQQKYYLFFDEIQRIPKWELAINSFKTDRKEQVSLFVTGSNSDLLSSEYATHIAGRYISFQISPFTFQEVCELKRISDKDKYELRSVFDDYMMWGGMPQRFVLSDVEQVKTYLSDIYDSIVVKDIIERFHIGDIDLFNRIVEYIVTTPSQTFSVEKLAKYFESDNRTVSKNTLYNYLEYMNKALLIHKADRYDVRGKRILNGKYKYYFTDLGLGQIRNVSKRTQLGAYLENIVYNELLSRGYDVKVGSVEGGKIDFIATRFQEKLYFQVAYQVYDEIQEREFGVYRNIDDNYPKYVLSMDTIDLSRDGIIHKNVIDWLLDR